MALSGVKARKVWFDWRTGERNEGVSSVGVRPPLWANGSEEWADTSRRHIMSDTEDVISVFVSKVSL